MAYVTINVVGDAFPTTRHVNWFIIFVSAHHATRWNENSRSSRKHIIMFEWDSSTVV